MAAMAFHGYQRLNRSRPVPRMPRVIVRPNVRLSSHFQVFLKALTMLEPSGLFVDRAMPLPAQIFPAQITPFIVAVALIDTVPCGIKTNAAGRLDPPNFRLWVAVVQLIELSPLLATMARFSAFASLLQGSVVVELVA